MGIIYHIFNPINGKCYIGQTRMSLEARWVSHKKANSGCRKLRNAIRKYGADKFILTVLTSNLSNDSDLNKAEAYWINYFDSMEEGYNISPGGDGHHQSAETKRRIGLVHRSNEKNLAYRQKISAIYQSIQESGVAPISGRGHNMKIRKPIMCLETEEIFLSQLHAATSMNLRQGNISRVLSGRVKKVGGFSFKFI
jgi:hypothetical protein